MPNTTFRGVDGSRLTLRRDSWLFGIFGPKSAIEAVESAIEAPIAVIVAIVAAVAAAVAVELKNKGAICGAKTTTATAAAIIAIVFRVLPTANTPAFVPDGTINSL